MSDFLLKTSLRRYKEHPYFTTEQIWSRRFSFFLFLKVYSYLDLITYHQLPVYCYFMHSFLLFSISSFILSFLWRFWKHLYWRIVALQGRVSFCFMLQTKQGKNPQLRDWSCSLEEKMWRETRDGEGWDWVILPPTELKRMHQLWPAAFRILYFNGKIKTHKISQLITSDTYEMKRK